MKLSPIARSGDRAQVYSHLKYQLAQQHPTDIDAYMNGKDLWINAIDAKAARS
ncbi:MAG: GrpB family protein [Leptolyngbyaceae cyanobacterium bins.349]|nr:GrpB family protein [Leptolyngbyaceae cyanobacterium bins.349]